jgi:hypothetical protein
MRVMISLIGDKKDEKLFDKRTYQATAKGA